MFALTFNKAKCRALKAGFARWRGNGRQQQQRW